MVLQLDINTLTAQAANAAGAPGAFGGVTHTGAINLSGNANSALQEILIGGAGQNIAAGQLASFTGSINLVNGGVTGGSLMFTLNDGESFSTQIVGGVGQVNTQAGQGFLIDGLLTNAAFTSDPFAGAGITPYFNAQPLDGSFLNFQFNPNANGVDTSTDLDVFLVPSAPAAGVLGLGLAGFASRRRR
ncbi:MAG: hypothetical protein ACTS27_04300 [Phycisphaerales bacterium]